MQTFETGRRFFHFLSVLCHFFVTPVGVWVCVCVLANVFSHVCVCLMPLCLCLAHEYRSRLAMQPTGAHLDDVCLSPQLAQLPQPLPSDVCASFLAKYATKSTRQALLQPANTLREIKTKIRGCKSKTPEIINIHNKLLNTVFRIFSKFSEKKGRNIEKMWYFKNRWENKDIF